MEPYAIIGDIVSSRQLDSREEVHHHLIRALTVLTPVLRPIQPLQPTVGDEFQGVFADLADATRATLLLRLELLPYADTRYGIGRGDVSVIDSARSPFIQDGSAWWRAREGLKELAKKSRRHQRSWLVTADQPAPPSSEESLANAYLMCRDALVDRLTPKGRAMLALALGGATQAEIADALAISESAVSQQFSRGIAAVRDAQSALEGGTR